MKRDTCKCSCWKPNLCAVISQKTHQDGWECLNNFAKRVSAHPNLHYFFSGPQIWAGGKGPRQKSQKSSKCIKTSFDIFDNFRAGQKTSKIVKRCQKIPTLFDNLRAAPIFRPLSGGADTCPKSAATHLQVAPPYFPCP